MFISKKAKLTSKKPLYKDKIKTDSGGYVWVYDSKTISKRWDLKRKKLQQLEKNVSKLTKSVEKDLQNEDLRTRAIAAVVMLCIETGIRIGNEESASEAKTYGATTLLKKHLKFNNGRVTLDFIGKDGVKQNLTVKNSKVIKVLKELVKDKKPGDRVFEIDGNKIWDRAINRYLKDFNISAKDLRGYKANTIMKQKLKNEDYKDALKETAKEVGHEPGTLEKNYLMPELVEKYKKAQLSKRAMTSDALEFIDSLKEKYLNQTTQETDKKYVDVDKKDKPARIRSGVHVNSLILDAWRSLLPFLPDTAIMTSGIRTNEDQEKIINYYWKKLPKEEQLKGENYNYADKVEILHRYGYKISAPGQSEHAKGNAFDVSGGSLEQIIQAINMVTASKIPVKFKNPLLEGKQNAVHVVVESAKYDPTIITEVLKENGMRTALNKSLSKRANVPEENKDYKRIRDLAIRAPKEYFKLPNKYPELDELAADSFLNLVGPINYFRANDIPKDNRTKNTNKKAVELLVNNDPYYYFGFATSYVDLKKQYPELALKAAINLAKKSPTQYDTFEELYTDPKYNEAKKIYGKWLINSNDYNDFEKEKFGFFTDPYFSDLIDYAAEKTAKYGFGDYFKLKFDQNPKYRELTDLAISTMVKNRPYDYFKNGLDKNPIFSKYKEKAGFDLMTNYFDDFMRLKLFNDPMFAELAKPEIALIQDYYYYFVSCELQYYPQFKEKTYEMAEKLINGDAENKQNYIEFGLAGIPYLDKLTEKLNFIDDNLKNDYKLTNTPKDNNFTSLTVSKFQYDQRNPITQGAKLYDFAINNALGKKENELEDEVLSSIYHQTLQGTHDVGMIGLTKSFGLVSFPKHDEMFLEEIQSDLPSVIHELKTNEETQTELIKKYGPEQYFKFINDATEHAAVYPYIVIQRAAEFAAANGINLLLISNADAVAEFANVKNKAKLEKIYTKIPEKLGFKPRPGSWIYSGNMQELAQKAKQSEQEVLQEMRQTKENIKQISKRPEAKKPKVLDVEAAKSILDSILGDRANQVNVSEDFAGVMKSLNELQKNKVITTKEKNEATALLNKQLKAYFNNLMEKYAFNFDYEFKKQATYKKPISKKASILKQSSISDRIKSYKKAYIEKPLIGILGRVQELDEPYYYVETRYIAPVLKCGGIPIILPLDELMYENLEYLDGIIFPGGNDVKQLYYTHRSEDRVPKKNDNDANLLKVFQKILPLNMPVLAICKGIQILNVYYGGTLEDIKGVNNLKHNKHHEFVVHDVYIKPDSILYNITHREKIKVLSAHHQRIAKLGHGVIPTGWAKDGTIEAMQISGRDDILGVQFHPEAIFTKENEDMDIQKNILDWFIGKSLSHKNYKKISTASISKRAKDEDTQIDRRIPEGVFQYHISKHELKKMVEENPLKLIENYADKYPELTGMALYNLAHENPLEYFKHNIYKMHPKYIREAAKNIAEKYPHMFFKLKLNEIWEATDFLQTAIINLIEKDPDAFLKTEYANLLFTQHFKEDAIEKKLNINASISKRAVEVQIPRVEIPLKQLQKDMGHGIDDQPGDHFEKNYMFINREKRPEYEELDATPDEIQKMLKEQPEEYFYRGLHRKYPEYEREALTNTLDNNAKFFFVFKYNEVPKFNDLMQVAAEKLSQQDVRAFFYYKLHHIYVELGRGAIIQLIDKDPGSFFDLGLSEDYPDYQQQAGNARNIINPQREQVEVVSVVAKLSKRSLYKKS